MNLRRSYRPRSAVRRPSISAACVSLAWLATAGSGLAEPQGTYETVALRRASDVAGGPPNSGLADPGLAGAQAGRVTFGQTLEWFDGTRCEDWSMVADTEAVANLDDPMLSDTQVSAARLNAELTDHRRNRHYRLICSDKLFATVAEIDGRVLVAPTPAGTDYVVLEKPLDADAARQVQAALKSTKFYDGPVNGTVDAATRRSLAYFAGYLGAAYDFNATPATQNLLAALGLPDLAEAVDTD